MNTKKIECNNEYEKIKYKSTSIEHDNKNEIDDKNKDDNNYNKREYNNISGHNIEEPTTNFNKDKKK